MISVIQSLHLGDGIWVEGLMRGQLQTTEVRLECQVSGYIDLLQYLEGSTVEHEE